MLKNNTDVNLQNFWRNNKFSENQNKDIFGSLDADTRRIKFIGFIITLAVIWNYSCSVVSGGWISLSIITAIILCLYIGYIWRYQDTLLAKYLIFAIAAGWIELFADCWLVKHTGTLVFIKGGPFVMCSPLYMPFAWANVLVYFGCMGYWLSKNYGFLISSLLTGVVGAIIIPLYEQWAKGANWWIYQNTPMLADTPLYIIGGEFLIIAILPFILRWVEKAPWGWGIVAGSLQGLWIWFSYALAFQFLNW